MRSMFFTLDFSSRFFFFCKKFLPATLIKTYPQRWIPAPPRALLSCGPAPAPSKWFNAVKCSLHLMEIHGN